MKIRDFNKDANKIICDFDIESKNNAITITGEIDTSDIFSVDTVIRYRFEMTRVLRSDKSQNLLKISIYNSIDGELGCVLNEISKLDRLPKKLENISAAFNKIPWEEKPIKATKSKCFGMIDIIKSLLTALPVEYTPSGLGFQYDDNNVPQYYVGTKIIDIKNPETSVPTVASSKIVNANKLDMTSFLKQNGDCNTVVDMVNAISKNKIAVQIVLSAALASIICGMLKLHSFSLCIAGKTSSGKSTIQKLASSFFSAVDDSSLNRRFSDTQKKLMSVFNGKNGVLLTIDDTSADTQHNHGRGARTENNLQQLIYYISGDHSRGKMTVADDEFHTVCIFSAEESVVDKFNMHSNGSRRRIVELNLDNFQNHLTSDAKEAQWIEKVITNNYGFIAEKFVTTVFSKCNLDEIRKKYYKVRDGIQECMSKEGSAQGYGETISAIVLAATLSDCIGFNFDAEEIQRYLIEEFEVSEFNYRKRMELSEFNFTQFYRMACTISFEKYGELMDEGEEAGKYIYLFNNDLEDICHKMNCNMNTIKKQLKERELLIKQDEKHDTWRLGKTKNDQYNNSRCYKILFDKELLEKEVSYNG